MKIRDEHMIPEQNIDVDYQSIFYHYLPIISLSAAPKQDINASVLNTHSVTTT